MPRYVLLRHDCPPALGAPSHWDLMLEFRGQLRTWRIESLPSRDGRSARALKLPDHRLAYLDYEGPLTGGRGAVTRVDTGELAWIEPEPPRLVAQLTAGALAGAMELTQIDGPEWELRLTAPGP
ncbi:MAG TPA: DNA polymerase ligase N-terminal domain-containing protein [Lacipirellulaceae bacterium]|nr:DNA polymerase ligase N-terminal domain-containing protein [Lacipirellulaceae bacterium]